MTLEIAINLDNAAFVEDREYELKRIFSELLKKLDSHDSGKILDSNGSSCGQFEIVTDDYIQKDYSRK